MPNDSQDGKDCIVDAFSRQRTHGGLTLGGAEPRGSQGNHFGAGAHEGLRTLKTEKLTNYRADARNSELVAKPCRENDPGFASAVPA